MDKLKELYALCNSEVSVTYNEHKGFYETVEQYLSQHQRVRDSELDLEVRAKMIEMNQMVVVQAYPLTPIGFYVVYQWDVEAAVQEMIDILKSMEGRR